MTIDPWLGAMREAQFRLAAELAARDWPDAAYFEVYPTGNERNCRSWLAIVDLEDGAEIGVVFETPFAVDAVDDRKWRRLNHLFWSGLSLKSKMWSVPLPLD